MKIRTKISDQDTDEHGNIRNIPIGTVGTVGELFGDVYLIDWENGAATLWTFEEIFRDAEAAQ